MVTEGYYICCLSLSVSVCHCVCLSVLDTFVMTLLNGCGWNCADGWKSVLDTASRVLVAMWFSLGRLVVDNAFIQQPLFQKRFIREIFQNRRRPGSVVNGLLKNGVLTVICPMASPGEPSSYCLRSTVWVLCWPTCVICLSRLHCYVTEATSVYKGTGTWICIAPEMTFCHERLSH